MNNIKRVLYIVFGVAILMSCDESGTDPVTDTLRFDLFQSSDFDYSGVMEVYENSTGVLTVDIQLLGAQASGVVFPAHLHFGPYDAPEAEIAFMLNPVSGDNLRSMTELGPLTNGNNLSFEDFKAFDGHVKVHLAADGPDYEVILVSGNVGVNYTAGSSIDVNKISICSTE